MNEGRSGSSENEARECSLFQGAEGSCRAVAPGRKQVKTPLII